jgi:fumarate hydratase class I
MASGSFGPTTAGRMDSYVDLFMQNGGSFVTLAKGNRSKQVRSTAPVGLAVRHRMQ